MNESQFNLSIVFTNDEGILHSEEWESISYYKVRSIVDEWMDDTVVEISVTRV
jgi:elongation factor P--beta-lysine ligase